jgi:hypothetical protein
MCPRGDQRLQLHREITNRDFSRHKTLVSATPNEPNPDGSWLILVLEGLNPAQFFQDPTTGGISQGSSANPNHRPFLFKDSS